LLELAGELDRLSHTAMGTSSVGPAGRRGFLLLAGFYVLLESFLLAGRQDLTDRTRLTVGQSITDACMGWEMTVPVLRELASAVRTRRPLLVNREQQLSSARSA
jgi:hypothetical protein